jgi:hypothetical protein
MFGYHYMVFKAFRSIIILHFKSSIRAQNIYIFLAIYKANEAQDYTLKRSQQQAY